MLTIHQRPFLPEDRSEAGHGEGDLVIGKRQWSPIGTLVERKTRLVRLLHLPRRDGDTLHDALEDRMGDLPARLLRSITWDQGTEMARHLTIAKSLGAQQATQARPGQPRASRSFRGAASLRGPASTAAERRRAAERPAPSIGDRNVLIW